MLHIILLKAMKNNGVFNLKAVEEIKLANEVYTLSIENKLQYVDHPNWVWFLQIKYENDKKLQSNHNIEQQTIEDQAKELTQAQQNDYEAMNIHIKVMKYLAKFFFNNYYNKNTIKLIINRWIFYGDNYKILIDDAYERQEFLFAFPIVSDQLTDHVQIVINYDKFYAIPCSSFWDVSTSKTKHYEYINKYKNTFTGSLFVESDAKKIVTALHEREQISKYKEQQEEKCKYSINILEVQPFKTLDEEKNIIDQFADPKFLHFCQKIIDLDMGLDYFICGRFGFCLSNKDECQYLKICNLESLDIYINFTFNKKKPMHLYAQRATVILSKNALSWELAPENINPTQTEEIIKNNVLILDKFKYISKKKLRETILECVNWTTQENPIDKIKADQAHFQNDKDLIELCKMLAGNDIKLRMVGLYAFSCVKFIDKIIVSVCNCGNRDYKIELTFFNKDNNLVLLNLKVIPTQIWEIKKDEKKIVESKDLKVIENNNNWIRNLNQTKTETSINLIDTNFSIIYKNVKEIQFKEKELEDLKTKQAINTNVKKDTQQQQIIQQSQSSQQQQNDVLNQKQPQSTEKDKIVNNNNSANNQITDNKMDQRQPISDNQSETIITNNSPNSNSHNSTSNINSQQQQQLLLQQQQQQLLLQQQQQQPTSNNNYYYNNNNQPTTITTTATITTKNDPRTTITTKNDPRTTITTTNSETTKETATSEARN